MSATTSMRHSTPMAIRTSVRWKPAGMSGTLANRPKIPSTRTVPHALIPLAQPEANAAGSISMAPQRSGRLGAFFFHAPIDANV